MTHIHEPGRQEAQHVEGDAIASTFNQGGTKWLTMSRGNRMARSQGQWIAIDEDYCVDVKDNR